MKPEFNSDILIEEVYPYEALMIGLLYNYPDLFDEYTDERFNYKYFGNKIFAFYFKIGKHLHSKNITVFNDLVLYECMKKLGCEKLYNEFGGWNVLNELIQETKEQKDNFEYFYQLIKKYHLLRNLRNLFGNRVLNDPDNLKYDYKKLSITQIERYWNDKLNNALLNENKIVKEYNLLEGLDDFVKDIDYNPDTGLEFYKGKKASEICAGWARSCIYLITAFSGVGKSDWVVHSLILSCIVNQQKLLVISNELSLKEMKKRLLVAVMGNELLYKKFNKGFNRKNINKGNFTNDEKEKLKMAIEWVRKIVIDESLIKFVPIDTYTIDELERIMKYYANRGYYYQIIDTTKPTSTSNTDVRWQRFVEDFERLEKIVKSDFGGADIALFCTLQASDSAKHLRYHDERVIADGKGIRRSADVLFHLRRVFESELEGGKNELRCFRFVKNDFGDGYTKKEFTLNRNKQYNLLFCSKNRRGRTNDTGENVLVYQVDSNNIRYREIGWCRVPQDE